MSSRLDHSREAKIEKRKKLESLGINPHPYFFKKTHTVAEALLVDEGSSIEIAGRIVSIREHGKLAFFDVRDESGTIQVIFSQEKLGEKFDVLNYIDTNDYIGINGKVGPSRSGQKSLFAADFFLLSKSLRPTPTTWQGLDDPEVRYRKRYLDMLINPDVKKLLDARWKILRETRNYLQTTQGYVEVETPILQPLYGGTNAKPFTTHMNALDSDFYLRIAPELYLKRLIIGGYERIFEIARNFRNEGIDQTHQPEFTMIEWYEAYADYNRIMDITEGLIQHLTRELYSSQILKIGDKEIDVSGTWPRIPMKDAIKNEAQIDIDALSDTKLQEQLQQHKIELTGSFSRGKAVFALFDHLVTPKLIQPTWIIDYPKEVSPLSKEHRKDPELVERFEGYIGGKEIADGWSEITDALEQRKRFEVEQQHMREGDDEAQPTDEDFLEAMEYGMPPLGGIGIGIDRLVMFLTNTWAIKEVIAFPTLRPLNAQPKTSQKKEIVKKTGVSSSMQVSPQDLLHHYIKNSALITHSEMVAKAMRAYAKELGEDEELWYQAGLLHDLDWEMFPDEHPNKAINELLSGYPQEILDAIASHAPQRTGKQPETLLERYLFACDELSGLMHAASLMRPNGFQDMEAKSIKKKIKDKAFARNVSREDIQKGFELIEKTPDEHISFLIKIFQS